ncbi:YeiH family protein [Caldicellulosiruptoraceae bacterium PP1]
MSRKVNLSSNNKMSYSKFSSIIVLIPGLIVVGIISIISILVQSTTLFSKIIPLSSLIISIIIGMIINNFITLPISTREGIRFSSKKILRLAIIFLGFKLSIWEVLKVGWSSIFTILLSSTLTIFFTIWLSKIIKVPFNRALLLGSGVSICGASAVAAVDAVIQAEEEDVAFAIGAITLFGTVYMFVYPIIHTIFNMGNEIYALWAGSSIHEVAQVAAASSVIIGKFRDMATTVKMIRVLFIVPLTLVISLMPMYRNKNSEQQKSNQKGKITIPWFAILFFITVLINTFVSIPFNIHQKLITFDNWIMTAAMAGLGLDISFKMMRNIGVRAFLLGAFSSLFISLISALIIELLINFKIFM